MENNTPILLRGCFLLYENGTVINAFTKESLPTKIIHGVKYVDFGTEVLTFKNSIGSMSRIIDLFGYALKRPKVRIDELVFLECLPIDGEMENLYPDNLIWKYPVGGLESKDFPGFFYVPGYSLYVVKQEGTDWRIVNKDTCHSKEWYVADTGYLQVSLRSDDFGRSEGVSLQRVLGLTFTDYPLNARELAVDHINNDRTCNQVENFQWLSVGENIRKGVLHNNSLVRSGGVGEKVFAQENRMQKRLNGRLKYLDVKTREVREVENISKVLSDLNLGDWQVRQSILAGNEGKIGLVRGRYVFRYAEDKLPEVTDEDMQKHLSYGGQPRATLLKDLSSGSVREFPSAAELVRSTNLSKKVVTTRLRRMGQRIPDSVYLVKYKDDTSPWIE